MNSPSCVFKLNLLSSTFPVVLLFFNIFLNTEGIQYTRIAVAWRRAFFFNCLKLEKKKRKEKEKFVRTKETAIYEYTVNKSTQNITCFV